MIFAAILAGGSGSRMGNTELPKQFLYLGNKPVLIHTIEKFSIIDDFDKIIVLTPKNFINHTKNLIDKYILDNDNIIVIEGGLTRNETILNSLIYIKNNFDIDDSSIILTHDAVRPFVSYKIIQDNIIASKKYGACDTVIPATDTIIQSKDSNSIDLIPIRNHCYHGQTPQSFKINKLYYLINELSEEEKNILTDAAKIFILKNQKVVLVKGDITNLKITYPYDLKLANLILEGYEYD